MSHTYTYATLEVSQSTYNEIAEKLRAAGYDHSFENDGTIDMHGIALVLQTTPSPPMKLNRKADPEPDASSFWHKVRNLLLS